MKAKKDKKGLTEYQKEQLKEIIIRPDGPVIDASANCPTQSTSPSTSEGTPPNNNPSPPSTNNNGGGGSGSVVRKW